MLEKIQHLIDDHQALLTILSISLIVSFILEKWVIKALAKVISRKNNIRASNIVEASRGLIYLLVCSTGLYISYLRRPDLYSEKTILLIKIAFIISITVFISRFIVAGMRNAMHDGQGGSIFSVSIIANIVRIIVYLIGAMIIIQTLGIDITPALTALGVGGLAVALALQDTLSNLFAGINVILGKKIGPGDLIRLESGEEGVIEDISWRISTVKLLNNTRVIIPNTKLSNSVIRNYMTDDNQQSMSVSVGVGYDNDLEEVERIALEVAKEVNKTNGIVENTNPVVRFTDFTDVSVRFLVVFTVKDFRDQGLIKHEYMKKIHLRFQQENIEVYSTANQIVNGVED